MCIIKINNNDNKTTGFIIIIVIRTTLDIERGERAHIIKINQSMNIPDFSVA